MCTGSFYLTMMKCEGGRVKGEANSPGKYRLFERLTLGLLNQEQVVAFGILDDGKCAPGLGVGFLDEDNAPITQLGVDGRQVAHFQRQGLSFTHNLPVMFPILIRQIEDDFCFRSLRCDGDPPGSCTWIERGIASEVKTQNIGIKNFGPLLVADKNRNCANTSNHDCSFIIEMAFSIDQVQRHYDSRQLASMELSDNLVVEIKEGAVRIVSCFDQIVFRLVVDRPELVPIIEGVGV